MLPVHVRVVDADTLKPIAVRLRVTNAAGRSCVPLGRPATFRTGPGEDVGGQVRLGDEDWYYVDGGAEVPIPPGTVRVRAWHGIEYLPLDETVEVKPGQLAVRLRMTRWTDERAKGWYSGDVCVFDVDPFCALLEGAAEDVAVVNVLARQAGDRITNMTAFSGSAPALDRPGHLVAVGTGNSHPEFGSLGLLGCHRPVFPLAFAGLDWSLLDWCEQGHRKRDGTVLGHGGPAGELLVAGLLGKLDGVGDAALADALWGVGVRVALVGGSGKDDNRTALGAMRTYACLSPGEPLTYPAWLAAVRAGRTYATSGPLLDLAVAGVGPGGVVAVAPGTEVAVTAEARSLGPLRSLRLLHDGAVVRDVAPSGENRSARLETHVRVDHGGWLAAWCGEQADRSAQTSAVYLRVEGRPHQPSAGFLDGLRAALQRTRDHARTAPGDDRFRRQLLANLDAAEARLHRP